MVVYLNVARLLNPLSKFDLIARSKVRSEYSNISHCLWERRFAESIYLYRFYNIYFIKYVDLVT